MSAAEEGRRKMSRSDWGAGGVVEHSLHEVRVIHGAEQHAGPTRVCVGLQLICLHREVKRSGSLLLAQTDTLEVT